MSISRTPRSRRAASTSRRSSSRLACARGTARMTRSPPRVVSSLDLTHSICDRALFHLDNCTYIPAVEMTGRVARTNVASNTAFPLVSGVRETSPRGLAVSRFGRSCR